MNTCRVSQANVRSVTVYPSISVSLKLTRLSAGILYYFSRHVAITTQTRTKNIRLYKIDEIDAS